MKNTFAAYTIEMKNVPECRERSTSLEKKKRMLVRQKRGREREKKHLFSRCIKEAYLHSHFFCYFLPRFVWMCMFECAYVFTEQEDTGVGNARILWKPRPRRLRPRQPRSEVVSDQWGREKGVNFRHIYLTRKQVKHDDGIELFPNHRANISSEKQMA